MIAMIRNGPPLIRYGAVLVDGGRYVVLLGAMERSGPSAIAIDDHPGHRGVCYSSREKVHVKQVFGHGYHFTAVNEPDNLIHLHIRLPKVES